jgi:hypothetical protein
MTVDSHASSSKFTVSASNMTITASGYTIKATAFQGDGSGLTGVPANDWDGSHTGDGVITGNLEVTGDTSGSSTSTGSFGRVDVVGRVVADKFFGDGTNLVGVTADWDGSHTGNGNISGTLTAGEFVGGGAGITGITGEWDGTHTGTATFTGNVTASGVVSASGGFVGDGSSLTGVGGGGLTHDFYASSSLVAGDGVIINADGSVKKVEQETVAKKIPMKTTGTANGTWYNSAGYEYNSGSTNTSKFLAYDPDTADRFIIAWGDSSNSNRGEACVGTITADDDNGIITYGGVATFDSSNITLFGCEFVPGSSTKFVVCYREDATDKIAARVGTISGTAPNETIAFGTEAIMTNPNACWNARIVMDPEDTTNGTFVIATQAYISGADNSGSAYVGSVSGTDITYGPEYQYDSSATTTDPHIDADPQGGGKFCIVYSTSANLLSKIATRSGTALTFGTATTVAGSGNTMYGLAYDPSTANSLICSYGSTYLIGGIQSGTSVSWGSQNSALYNTAGGGTIRFHPSVAGEWVMAHQLGTNNADGLVTRGTLSGTTITTGTSSTYRDKIVDSSFSYPNIKFDNVTAGKFTVMFGGYGGYEQTSGRCSVGRITSTSTNLTTSNWSGMATGTTSASLQASITTRGGVATGVTGSGLTPGTIYYLQGDGSLATTADTPSVKAGKALSATSIILTSAPLDVDGSPYATSAQGDTAVSALANAATAQTTADAALPKAGGAMTGAITTNSTFDGVDIATRDGILTSTTTTAGAALPKAGGTMTGGLIGTTATFTGNVSSSLTSTGSFGMVLVGGSVLASADGFDYTSGSSPVVTTNPSSVGSTWINTTSGEIFVATDITAGENVWKGTNSSSIAPQAVTYFGARGVWAGGYPEAAGLNVIDYITIATTGNATDFGDLTRSSYDPSACADSSKGVFGGGKAGNTDHNVIDYVTISTTGNATDFGDLTVARQGPAALSDGTRGIWGGGSAGNSRSNTIDYITIATTGNAVDFGDLTLSRQHPGAASNGTRGMWAGGYIGGNPSYTKVMDYVTIATLGNATSFGDLDTWGAAYVGGTSNGTRGMFAGGYSSSYKNWILYVTIATTGNSADFGDLTLARKNIAAASDGTKGVFGGGRTSASPYYMDTLDYVTMASTGNAVDFGDLSVARDRPGACSG